MSEGSIADLRQPLPNDAPSVISGEHINRSNVEAAINLQMDYLLVKKAMLIKALFFSRFSMTVIFTIISVLTHNKLSSYYSVYNFPESESFFNSLLKLFKTNSFFRDDVFALVIQSMFFVSVVWVVLWLRTSFLKHESDEVPDNLTKYFGAEADLSIFKSNDTKQIKKLTKILNENSRVISYRNVPIAFISKTPTQKAEEHKLEETPTTSADAGEGAFNITGLGIRRVYIRSGILNELLMFFQQDKKVSKLNVEIYSFEKDDAKILRDNGFQCVREAKIPDFLLGTIFGVSVSTFSWNSDSLATGSI